MPQLLHVALALPASDQPVRQATGSANHTGQSRFRSARAVVMPVGGCQPMLIRAGLEPGAAGLAVSEQLRIGVLDRPESGHGR